MRELELYDNKHDVAYFYHPTPGDTWEEREMFVFRRKIDLHRWPVGDRYRKLKAPGAVMLVRYSKQRGKDAVDVITAINTALSSPCVDVMPYRVCYQNDAASKALYACLAIARLPDRVGPFVPDDRTSAPDPGQHTLYVLRYSGSEQDTPGARSLRGPGAVPLPRLLPGTCAACGTVRVALKRCAACGLAEYCDRECQRAHWAQHKPACRAAAAKA
jgi:hypothetical protein